MVDLETWLNAVPYTSHAFGKPRQVMNVGVREIADHVWLISFMHYGLGFFDDQSSRAECAPNPFGANVLPICPERTLSWLVGAPGFEPGTPCTPCKCATRLRHAPTGE